MIVAGKLYRKVAARPLHRPDNSEKTNGSIPLKNKILTETETRLRNTGGSLETQLDVNS